MMALAKLKNIFIIKINQRVSFLFHVVFLARLKETRSSIELEKVWEKKK